MFLSFEKIIYTLNAENSNVYVEKLLFFLIFPTYFSC